MRAATAPPASPMVAAEVVHPPSGRCMRLLTDAPGVQLYAGGFLGGLVPGATEAGKGGAKYAAHGGFCLETQNFPDAINQAKAGFPSPVLRPGERYIHTMVTQFFTAAQ